MKRFRVLPIGIGLVIGLLAFQNCGSQFEASRSLQSQSRSENTESLEVPLKDTWSPISTTGAPSARYGHSAVWTGSKMIVWGGRADPVSKIGELTGGSYDPATDSWAATSTVGAPSARSKHTAVWTGSKMLVWGGLRAFGLTFADDGGAYDPITDSWTPISLPSSGPPVARQGHIAVWTGSKMIVWGGTTPGGLTVDDGAVYDPATDSWISLAQSGAIPMHRQDATAVFTGKGILMWGGVSWPKDNPDIYPNTAHYLDLDTLVWSDVPLPMGSPLGRRGSAFAWTGWKALFWGGVSLDLSTPINSDVTYPESGYAYDLNLNAWVQMNSVDSPGQRAYSSGTWTGKGMIVWGGIDPTSTILYNTGFIYE